MANKRLVDYLIAIRDEHAQQAEQYKAKAYDKVITQLKRLPKPITTIEELGGVKGIGVSIRSKIEGYLSSQSPLMVDQGPPSRQEAITELRRIHGIGEVKAKKLIDAGITTIAQLQTDPSLLNAKQQLALKYVAWSSERIPRVEMELHNTLLVNTGWRVDPELVVVITGSFRRGAPTSGDIDVLIAHPRDDQAKIHQFVKQLVVDGYIIDELAYGEHKFLGYSQLKGEGDPPRRLDLLFTPIKELPFALLHFTGSQQYNIAVRRTAIAKGYSLSEHGFDGITQTFTSEQEVLAFIGLPYLPPTERNL